VEIKQKTGGFLYTPPNYVCEGYNKAKNRQLKKFLFLVTAAILNRGYQKQFRKGTTQGQSQPSLVEFGSVVSEEI
jgi:hypothetical protein